MSKLNAQEVIEQIKTHYSKEHSFNYPDMISHLKSDMIDAGEKSVLSHSGFDADESMAVFYYSDGSGLIVSYGFTAFKELKED